MSVSSLKAGGNGGMHKVTRWMVSMVAITTFASTWYTEPVAAVDYAHPDELLLPLPIKIPSADGLALPLIAVRRWNAILQRILAYEPPAEHRKLYRDVFDRLKGGDIPPSSDLAHLIEKAKKGKISRSLQQKIAKYLVNLLIGDKLTCPVEWTDKVHKENVKLLKEYVADCFTNPQAPYFTFE
ncbi:hypothetical protein BaOVIS_007890 [Babesia ovis]|uniref:Uncharacterized protein n=1 Tax=Babesia ovis TaxID=5869 RepID=A0A9W5WTY6_BABOV|nr:hypothetical protein BaOVIS_007890 [Babesia ovis]